MANRRKGKRIGRKEIQSNELKSVFVTLIEGNAVTRLHLYFMEHFM